MIVTGRVVSNNINPKGEKSAAVELRDPEYTSLTQRFVVPGEYKLGSELKITIEELT